MQPPKVIGDARILYHYTSVPALVSILNGNVLWFSRGDCMDDPEEWLHGVGVCRNAILQLIEDEPAGGWPPDYLNQLYEVRSEFACRENNLNVGRVPFLFSVCEDGDDLDLSC